MSVDGLVLRLKPSKNTWQHFQIDLNIMSYLIHFLQKSLKYDFNFLKIFFCIAIYFVFLNISHFNCHFWYFYLRAIYCENNSLHKRRSTNATWQPLLAQMKQNITLPICGFTMIYFGCGYYYFTDLKWIFCL